MPWYETKSTAAQGALPFANGDRAGAWAGDGQYACGPGNTRPHARYAVSAAATFAGPAPVSGPSGLINTTTAMRAASPGLRIADMAPTPPTLAIIPARAGSSPLTPLAV